MSTSSEMMQTIRPDTIHLLAENIGIIMDSNVEKYAAENIKDLPVVRIGRIHGKLYAIDHCDVVIGCKQSKKNVKCVIEEFQNISDILVQHFCSVTSSDVINTPMIYGLVDSLQKKLKTDKITVLRILGIDKLQYYRLMVSTNNMAESAISKLEELVDILSKRKGLTAMQASVPIYVLEKISRISDEEQQLLLIHFVQSDLQKKSDSRLFWMTPEQIDSITQMVRQNATRTENKREESTIAEFVPVGEKIKEDESTQADSLDFKKVKQKISKNTKEILDTIPNILVIPDEKGDPDFLVDKKTGAVSKIDASTNKKIIKTRSIPSKKLYSIPLDVASFLGMDQGQIRHKNISNTDDLHSFVDSQKDASQRYTIFWNVQ